MVRLFTPPRLLLAATGLLASCSSSETASEVVVSVKDQKMGIYSEGLLKKEYAISTSKFGLGDELNSYRTPLGKHEVIAKIGHGLPPGAVLKSRHWNGEVLKPNAPGRDPIVSRILWLNGLENDNSNAKRRYIYIHGTTEESRLGQPASYGCIRMGMQDVVDAFNEVNIGDKVVITKKPLPSGKAPAKAKEEEVKPAEAEAPTAPVVPEPVALAAKPKPAAPTPATKKPQTDPLTAGAPSEATPASLFKRFFHGPKTASPAAESVVSAATPAVKAPTAEAPSLEETATTESRSFLTRLLFRKKAEPAAVAPTEPVADPVGPEKPKDIAKQRTSREPRASRLSARPQPVVAANSRA
jgi:hypothetical protein